MARPAATHSWAVNLFDVNFLFASLIWGSIGLGYCIYGKRQRSVIPLVGGVLMIAVSYLIASALVMSLVCAALMSLVYVLLRQGY
jgi:hypothetical protein